LVERPTEPWRRPIGDETTTVRLRGSSNLDGVDVGADDPPLFNRRSTRIDVAPTCLVKALGRGGDLSLLRRQERRSLLHPTREDGHGRFFRTLDDSRRDN